MLRWMAGAARSNLQRGHQEWKRTASKVDLYVEVPGKRPKGRPKLRSLDTLHADLKLAGIHPDEAHDRAKWRQWTTKADPATKWDKR
ncbi:hypothetical protein ANCDUO_06085 [Ancylostoma duodenale]|uniref:Uncharacterized protein n=1 Tax=Ancylostoma duodenale TaxID=51022 RepID=A0A0C2H2F8_9BILA|nr:hypothetical protein ANCDUO_06085 [Ancylostoma duodenale]